MQKRDKNEINAIVKSYKTDQGHPNFPALFTIPSEHRLPELAKKDYKLAAGLVVAGLTSAFESMNLSRPMNAAQIIDLADAVLDTSAEDNLSLEDLVLFLQKLVRGEYGVLYESMDIPKFMEKFEKYREERYQAIKNIRDEQAANHRPDYSDQRISEQSKRAESAKNISAIIATGERYKNKGFENGEPLKLHL